MNILIRSAALTSHSLICSLLRPKSIRNLSISSDLVKKFVIKKSEFELKTKFRATNFTFEYNLKGNTYHKALPYAWLRSYCRCPQCYSTSNEELELSLLDVTSGVHPVDIMESNKNDRTEIVWNDNHKSSYNLVELVDTLFESEIRKSNSESSPLFWDKEILSEKNGLPSVDYETYLRDEGSLRKALQSIVKYGAILIDNVTI